MTLDARHFIPWHSNPLLAGRHVPRGPSIPIRQSTHPRREDTAKLEVVARATLVSCDHLGGKQ